MKHKKPKKSAKMLARRVVRFERDSRERFAVKLAMACQSTKIIAKKTGLTESQVEYRLKRAKDEGGYALGFRTAWRLGRSPLLYQFLEDSAAIMDAEIDRNIQITIDHPTPETVNVG